MADQGLRTQIFNKITSCEALKDERAIAVLSWIEDWQAGEHTLEEAVALENEALGRIYLEWHNEQGAQYDASREQPWKLRRVQKSNRSRYLLKILLNYLEEIAPEDPAAVIQINWDGPEGFVTVTVTLDKGCLPNTPNGIMDAWLKTLGYGKPWVEAGRPGIEKTENTSTDMMLIRLVNWNVTICVDWASMHTVMLSVF